MRPWHAVFAVVLRSPDCVSSGGRQHRNNQAQPDPHGVAKYGIPGLSDTGRFNLDHLRFGQRIGHLVIRIFKQGPGVLELGFQQSP